MSGPDQNTTALVALIISLIALILTLLQVAQQYVATAYDYRHCSKRTVGGWSKRSSRQFIWSELRFEVLFTTPIIRIGLLPSDSQGGDSYAVPTTRLDVPMSNDKAQESSSTMSLSSSHSDSAFSNGAQYILNTSEGNKMYTSSQKPWFLDLKGTRPEAKCTWLSLLNDVSITHLQIDINERLLSYDFMPDGIKKPLAQMDRKSFLTIMSLFQVSWQEGYGRENNERTEWGGGRKDTPTGAGPYCEVTSRDLVNFGTVVSYQLSGVQPARRFYIVSEKAREAMFNRFDLGFHVVSTQSAEEVYRSVLRLADENTASTIRDVNASNNGWSPGLAEIIGCFAEPEMPKAVEHGRDKFISIFSVRSIGCILNDYPVIQLLIGEKIENSTKDAERISEWANDYIRFSSHPPPHNDSVQLPTDQLLALLNFACRFFQMQARLGETISWSDSRKALAMIKLLDKQLSILCRQLSPTQPEVEVQREFARLQVRFGHTLFQDTLQKGGFWRDFIGCVVAANYVKICSSLEKKYPGSEQEVRGGFVINRLMRGVLWHIHNGNNPTGHDRQLECSLNSRWLSDTSTIWID
jgi:hypothetical protein